jgi:hypothetical protein
MKDAKLGPYCSLRLKRWVKKVTARFRRRQGKRLLDDAPKQARYGGWAD